MDKKRVAMNVFSKHTVWIPIILLLSLATPALSAPRYVDREKALQLAEILDKGLYASKVITSTFIQGIGEGKYFIKVILDNGRELNWDIAQIRSLAKKDVLSLRNNGALLFLNDENNEFAVLNKNRFTQLALKSKVFVKHYEEPDILAGETINFSLRQFNLAALLKTGKQRDPWGYRRHYVLDLDNGAREQLSYLEAYKALRRNSLSGDTGSVSPLLRAAYSLRRVAPHDLEKLNVDGVGRFSLEMVFDRTVQLEPSHFPFQFYEIPAPRGRGGFVVEITFPNAQMPNPIRPIKSLEFLRRVHVVTDPKHHRRLLLRAFLNPGVLTSPPKVAVDGSSVLVTFTKVMDQSKLDPKIRVDTDLRLKQEQLLHRTLSPEEIQKRKTYRAQMASGKAHLRAARRARNFGGKYTSWRNALNAFIHASTLASDDTELKKAMKERNYLMVRIPMEVVKRASRAIKNGKTSGALKDVLEDSARLTTNSKLRRQINRLLRKF